MNTDTIVIVVAILGVGLALWRAMDSRHKDARQDMAALRQEIKKTNSRFDSMGEKTTARIDAMAATLNSRIDALRQELRTDIAALHSRIDALYQALFNHKDPVA